MATSVPGFVALPRAWERMTIDGVDVPGYVQVTGRLARRDDTAEVPGQDGATQTVLGYAPAEFSVTVTLWTDAQLAAYQAVVRRFRPQREQAKTAAARALQIRHPAVQLCGISELTIYEMTAPEHQGKGEWRATMALREFIPEPKRAKSKGVKAVTGPPAQAGSISGQLLGGPATANASVAALMAQAADTWPPPV